MTANIRGYSLALAVVVSLTAGPAVAGPYEDAIAGYEAEQAGNYSEALRLYTRAAEAGHAYGQFSLASMYLSGTGVTQDAQKAVEWFRKSAEQGNSDAQFNLALILDTGSGVPENNAEAAKWYATPAEEGNVDAQVNLAFLHLTGSGVSKNNQEAVRLFTMAAEQGHAGAQYNLGLVYVNDEAPHDFVQGHKWLSAAASNPADTSSLEQAATALRDLEARMTPAQISEAKR